MQTVAPDKVSDFSHYAFGAVRIEPPRIEDLIRTVIAGIRAAYTGGISEFTNAAKSFISIEVSQLVSRHLQLVQVLNGPVRLVHYLPFALERCATHAGGVSTPGKSLRKFDQCQ